MSKRTAAFFYSEVPKSGFTPVPIEGGRTGYVRGALTPPNTSLVGVLDWAHASVPGASDRYPEDECFMNGHYVSAPKKPVKCQVVPVCSRCGSEDVKGDAYAVWDKDTQQWEVAGGDVFDKGAVCEPCGGETTIKWRKV